MMPGAGITDRAHFAAADGDSDHPCRVPPTPPRPQRWLAGDPSSLPRAWFCVASESTRSQAVTLATIGFKFEKQ